MSIDTQLVDTLRNDNMLVDFVKMVQEGVNLLKDLDDLNEKRRVLSSQAKELFPVTSKDFNNLVKYSYNESQLHEDLQYLSNVEGVLTGITEE